MSRLEKLMRGIQVNEFGPELFFGFLLWKCDKYSMICINRFDLVLDVSTFKSFFPLVDETHVLFLL
jgi:hypothetical protein